MLTSLSIRDYAIIHELDLDFRTGLSVMTGETGAGKSIIVDALGLVLGDRADTGAVRHGAERAEITAVFDTLGIAGIEEWLVENDLHEGAECILRRVVGADGRSRGFINGRPAPLTLMRDLGERLVDIHGQHEHQSLLRKDAQLELLDAHGGHHDLLVELHSAWEGWHAAHEAWEKLQLAASDRAARLELLGFQARELAVLALAPGEVEELEVEHTRLANSGRLMESAQQALMLADGDDEVHARSLLHQTVTALAEVAEFDPKLAEIHQLMEQALVQLGEGADDLRRWLDRFDLDPERKALVENRIGTAHQLARKHRVEARDLPALYDRLQQEFAELDQADSRLEALRKEQDAQVARYRECAARIHKARSKTAAALAKSVSEEMQALGMTGGRLEISVAHDAERFSKLGGDQVEFLVSANAGQPPRSLAKTASGGELSRISLAIQVTAANADTIGCLIFDEVDSGVGGAVAEIVGKKLRELAKGRQVLCVTHLPQVASQAHHHYRVEKSASDGETRTGIAALTEKQRVEELARMLGGLTVTDKVRATAREMLKSAY